MFNSGSSELSTKIMEPTSPLLDKENNGGSQEQAAGRSGIPENRSILSTLPGKPQEDDIAYRCQSPTKKLRCFSSFRDWSGADQYRPGPLYKIKVVYFDALPTSFQSIRKTQLVSLLHDRGLPTQGNKDDLVKRLLNEKPYICIEIDGRESVQRLIHSAIHYMGWDTSLPFTVSLPKRGSCLAGQVSLMDAMDLLPLKAFLKNRLRKHPRKAASSWMDEITWKTYIEPRLLGGRYSVDDVKRAITDEEVVGRFRVLHGHAADPWHQSWDSCKGRAMEPQGHYSLYELACQPGDTMTLEYNDSRERNKFLLHVEKMDQSATLTEIRLGQHDTRVRFLQSGLAKLPQQLS